MNFKILLENHFESKEDFIAFLDKHPLIKDAIELLSLIESLEKNKKAYIVGGAVRDIILGKSPKDIDIATNVNMTKIKNHFRTFSKGSNEDFGIVNIIHNGEEYEIAQFRQDGTYVDGRRPDKIKIVLDFKDDAERRDFTFNAMALDKDGNIIDYFNGQEDLKNKILKTVGNPDKRFSEDYLRMLRAVRFSSKLDMKLSDDIKSSIKGSAENINKISKERIIDEVRKMAKQSGSNFAKAIETLDEIGLLKHILPSIFKMKSFEHSKDTHPEGNVFQHTIAALKTNELDDEILNLAILFHDIGKLETKGFNTEKKRITYLGHAEKGVEMMKEIAKELRIDNETLNKILFVIQHHMKFHNLLEMSDKKILELMKSDNWELLYKAAMSDAFSRNLDKDKEHFTLIDKRIEDLRKNFKGNLDAYKKFINGDLIKRITNLRPGPVYKEIIDKATEFAVKNRLDVENGNHRSKIMNYIKSL